MSRTYVTGLWIVTNNPKRSPEHYFGYLPTTFALLRGCRIIFHYDDDLVMKKASDLAKEYRIILEPRRLPLQDIDCWGWAEQFADACESMRLDEFSQADDFANEKGVVHFWRDLRMGGRDTWIRMLVIWLSKILLVAGVARRETMASVAWVDASIARFNQKRENWDFTHIASIPGCISHYGNDMRFYGRLLPLNASYLEGDRQAWESLERLYLGVLPKAARMPYGHDEETVLGQCVAQVPKLFRCIGQPSTRPPRTPRRRLLKFLRRLTKE